jgi:uncharacterized protein YdhG (YjbR/CyaY superfamily)
MPARKPAKKSAPKTETGFSEEERAAMKERLKEFRARPRPGKENGERDLLAKVAEMQTSDRVMAERIHAIMKTHAPNLVPRTWYGMPAYSKDDEVLCFFRPAEKFKTRYATLGFSDAAKLDEGPMWPTDFALKQLGGAEEARIVALVRRALG